MALPFLDTNVFLRHLLQDHSAHSPLATAHLAQIEQGQIRARTADTVVFEVVFTLQRYYKQPREKIRDSFLPLLELPGIILPGKQHFRQVFTWCIDLNLPFADAYHAVLMKRLNLNEIVSFDSDFDRIPGIERHKF